MTTYRVHTPQFVVALVEAGDLVVQAGPILHWTVGRSFQQVRDHCRARGWIIEPLIDPNPPTWLEVEGLAYELHWHEGRITRITKHERDEDPIDVTMADLPDVLKGLL